MCGKEYSLILLSVICFWSISPQLSFSQSREISDDFTAPFGSQVPLSLDSIQLATPVQSPPNIQTPKDPKGFEFGVSMTGTRYVGDLSVLDHAQGPFTRFYPGIEAYIAPQATRVQFSGIVGQATFVAGDGRIEAGQGINMTNSEPGVEPNDFAYTTLTYIMPSLKWYVLSRATIWRPWLQLSGGPGFFRSLNENGVALSALPKSRLPGENYGTVSFVGRGGLGLDIQIGAQISMQASYQYWRMGTDYMDNIGALGTMKGNDRLHQVQLGIIIDLMPVKK